MIQVPILTPLRLFPKAVDFTGGDNYINPDNTRQEDMIQEGLYNSTFYQAFQKTWHDDSDGLEFQVMSTAAAETLSAKSFKMDGDTEIEDMTCTKVFTYSGSDTAVWTISMATPANYTTNTIYYIEVYTTSSGYDYVSDYWYFEDSGVNLARYWAPLEYSNFENDFGLIFDNGSGTTFAGKVLVPLQMYKPAPAIEKETVNDYKGVPLTLRTTIRRGYELVTAPVPVWFAEKLLIIFGCSELELNKITVNNTDDLGIEIFEQSDMAEVTGTVYFTDFNDYYNNEAVDN